MQGGCGKDTYPNLCIHPGWKAAVGARLALGARRVAYNDSSAYYSGPIFSAATARKGGRTVTVHFRAAGAAGITVRDRSGFEVVSCYGSGCDNKTALAWTKVAVAASSTVDSTVTLGPLPPGFFASTVGTGAGPQEASAGPTAGGVRYLWSQSPCQHPRLHIGNCSVYSKAEGLPATPFVGTIDLN
jgi:hypothetical protein